MRVVSANSTFGILSVFDFLPVGFGIQKVSDFVSPSPMLALLSENVRDVLISIEPTLFTVEKYSLEENLGPSTKDLIIVYNLMNNNDCLTKLKF